jgi:hypothetical protein
MQYYRISFCVCMISLALFFPPIAYFVVFFFIISNGGFHVIEKISIYLSLTLAVSFKIAFIDFHAGGAEDFFNYYYAYRDIYYSADGLLSELSTFPQFLGFNIEVLLPFIFIVIKLFFPFLINPNQFAFIITFVIFSVYFFGLSRLLFQRTSVITSRNESSLIFFIAIIALSDVIFYQLLRQGLAGAFVLLALTEVRIFRFFIYFLLAILSHASSLFLLPLLLFLRSKNGFGPVAAITLGALIFYMKPELIFNFFEFIPKLNFYNLDLLGEPLSNAFNFWQNALLISLCVLLYLASKLAPKFKASEFEAISQVVGGGNSILFFSFVFFVFGSIPLLFDRIALLYVTLLIWVHIACFSMAWRRFYVPYVLIFFLILWRFNYLIDNQFFYVSDKWFSFVIFRLFQ